MVTSRSTILKIRAKSPSKIRLVKSLVYIGSEPAPCSKAAQKKTVKNENIVKAIILSLTITVYLGIRIINSTTKLINAIKAKNKESPIPPIVKLNVSIPPILLKGSLIIKINALQIKIKIRT